MKNKRPSETQLELQTAFLYVFSNKVQIIVQTSIGFIKPTGKYPLMMLLQEHIMPANDQASTFQTACFCILCAISSTARTAVIRLPESALPVPAKFKAVP